MMLKGIRDRVDVISDEFTTMLLDAWLVNVSVLSPILKVVLMVLLWLALKFVDIQHEAIILASSKDITGLPSGSIKR